MTESSMNVGESSPLLQNGNVGADSIGLNLRAAAPHRVQTYRQQSRYKCFYVCLEVSILAAILLLLKIALERTQSVQNHISKHGHVFPTLLSTRDHLSGDYINAIDNTLYNEMKHAIYHDVPSSLEMTTPHDSPTTEELKRKATHTTNPILQLSTHKLSFHDELKVSWDNMASIVQDSDVVAMYCPATEKDPTQFRDAATIAQIHKTSQLFQRTLENRERTSSDVYEDTNTWWIPSFPIIRENSCVFKLWKRVDEWDRPQESSIYTSPHSYRLMAHSDTLFIRGGREIPTMIHLALTSNPSEMRVHFTTGVEGVPIVVYGTNATFSKRARGQSTTYNTSHLCQGPANIEEPGKFTQPGMLHSVIMSDLSEDTLYFYQVAVEDDTGSAIFWSDIYTFQSPIFPGSQTPFSFLVYADQGVPGYGNRNMASRVTHWTEHEVNQNQIRLVHHFGDLSYAQGVGHIWDQWLDMVSAFSTTVPLMIGIGNHEYDHTAGGENGKDPSGLVTPSGFSPGWGDMGNDSNGECGVPASKRFIMPLNGNGVFWYSFDYGMIHTIVLSSEHNLSPSSSQYEWLENDLQKVNRSVTPWLVVESHRPLYCSLNIPKDSIVGDSMRREFEHLLHQYNVDLFLAGHYHIYQRSCNGLYQSKCNVGGPAHITIGSAGADLDLTASLLRRSWSASFLREHGYGRISVMNSSVLHFEFISNEDGLVKDETWLMK